MPSYAGIIRFRYEGQKKIADWIPADSSVSAMCSPGDVYFRIYYSGYGESCQEGEDMDKIAR